MFGDVFIHLIPELAEDGFSVVTSFIILGGIALFFIIEKLIHWRHCHEPVCEGHNPALASINLIGDGVHNYIDGIIIAASYLISIPVGIATTVAVLLHEIPQEVGDFGVLVHAGYSKSKALFYNFITALVALLGGATVLFLHQYTNNIESFLVPLAAGGFIYIAGVDLIPELHKESKTKKSFSQFLALVLGIAVMGLLLFFE